VLSCLFGQPNRSFFANELISLTGSGSGAVQRELKRLSESGLVLSKKIGNQRHFQANKSAPIFSELVQIVEKTFGVAEPIRKALLPYEGVIRCAFLFGSVAKNADSSSSDIDLFVVSDSLRMADLINPLLSVEVQIGRAINTTVFSPTDLRKGLSEDNAFLTRVIEGPKLWVFGDESNLSA
jgi:predicted nucleotidyltransferase